MSSGELNDLVLAFLNKGGQIEVIGPGPKGGVRRSLTEHEVVVACYHKVKTAGRVDRIVPLRVKGNLS